MTQRLRRLCSLLCLLALTAGLSMAGAHFLRFDNALRTATAAMVAPKKRERPEYRWGTPTPAEAEHGGYIRGHAGHFTEWVLEYLTPESFVNKAPRKDHFRPDPDVPEEFRATLADYKDHPKYDRGHLPPAADMHWSAEAMDSCFLLSAMTPQTKKLNELARAWEGLEEHIRAVASADGAKVWVITGPAFLPDAEGVISFETIGAHVVWVPTHCFKAAYIELGDKYWMEGYMMPNVADPPRWQDCRVSIDSLEADTGFDFFSGLENTVEVELEGAKP